MHNDKIVLLSDAFVRYMHRHPATPLGRMVSEVLDRYAAEVARLDKVAELRRLRSRSATFEAIAARVA